MLHKGGQMMNRNPLIPFVIIMIIGILAMFLISFKGIGDRKEIAAEKEGGSKLTEDVISSSPEEIYQKSCIGCHGDSYQGGIGPALTNIGDKKTKDEIKKIITEGTNGGMPSGLVSTEMVDEMADWLTELK